MESYEIDRFDPVKQDEESDMSSDEQGCGERHRIGLSRLINSLSKSILLPPEAFPSRSEELL